MSTYDHLEPAISRWVAHWDITQRVAPGLPPEEKLRGALLSFVDAEMDDAEDEAPRRLIAARAVVAIRRSGTHSPEFVDHVVNSLAKPPIKRRFSAPLRKAMVAWAVWAVAVALWYAVFAPDNHDSAVRAVTLALAVPALALAARTGWRWASR